MTQVEKVKNVLLSGRELTAKQIASQFKIASPRKIVSLIRRDHGVPVYCNKRTDTAGRVVYKYRAGTPTKALIKAGFAAQSLGF